MDAISLFSGAGGMDLGFGLAGFKTVLACELNKDACATFRRNDLGPIVQGDVRSLLAKLERGSADLVFGGPPCQGISVAGKMDPNDPRSGLIDTFLDAVETVAPRAFIMENVDALLALAKWRPRLESIRSRAGDIGFGIHCVVLNAADFGVPQSRSRFFAIGLRGASDDDVAEMVTAQLASLMTAHVPASDVFERLGRQGTDRNPATSNAIITFLKKPVMRRTAYAGMLFNGRGRPINPSRPAPTMTAAAGGNKTHIIDERQVFGDGGSFCEDYHRHLVEGGKPGAMPVPSTLRRLTINESAAFQGFPEGFVFEGKTSAVYRQIGNAVPVGLARAVAQSVREILSAAHAADNPESIAA